MGVSFKQNLMQQSKINVDGGLIKESITWLYYRIQSHCKTLFHEKKCKFSDLQEVKKGYFYVVFEPTSDFIKVSYVWPRTFKKVELKHKIHWNTLDESVKNILCWHILKNEQSKVSISLLRKHYNTLYEALVSQVNQCPFNLSDYYQEDKKDVQVRYYVKPNLMVSISLIGKYEDRDVAEQEVFQLDTGIQHGLMEMMLTNKFQTYKTAVPTVFYNEETCDYCSKSIALDTYYNFGGCCGKCASE